MTLRSHCEVVTVFDLPENRLHVALPPVSQKNILGAPVMAICNDNASAEYFIVKTGAGLFIYPVNQPLGTLSLRVIFDM